MTAMFIPISAIHTQAIASQMGIEVSLQESLLDEEIIIKLWFSMGGTIAEDQYASQDSWKKLIAFFHTSLKSEDL